MDGFDLPFALDQLGFWELCLATVFIAAAGNVINDIHDIRVDTINKPSKVIVGKVISEKRAFNYYLVLNVLGVGLGFLVANRVDKPSLAVLFIIVSALLYWYATSLKNILLVGNFVVSGLVGFSIFILVLFEVYPILTPMNRALYMDLVQVLVAYSFVAAYMNVIREIVKDIQDINGDKNGGRQSLPIVLGIDRTKLVVFSLGLMALFWLLLFSYYDLYQHTFLLGYFIFCIGGPLLYYCIKTWQAEKAKDFSLPSLLLKLVMFFGVLSIAFIETIVS